LEHDPVSPPSRYDAWLEDFLRAECQERGLALATRKNRQWHIQTFLTYLEQKGYPLESLTPITSTLISRTAAKRGTVFL
jgi:site-specific recombinase XerD